MSDYIDIKKAKEVGKKIKSLRESHKMSIQSLAAVCGFSVLQIVNLENGNYFAFNQSLEQFLLSATHCLEVVGNRHSEPANDDLIPTFNTVSQDEFIPAFLRKLG